MRKTVSTIAIAAALMLGGCGKHFGRQPTETGTDNGSDTSAKAMTNATARQAPDTTPTAQQFADQAASGDAFEIAAANLALKLAKSPNVRSFAAMMITEHRATAAQIRKAAAASNPALTPNATLSEDQRNTLQDLGALTGGEFDDRYADGQVSAHEAALTLMQTYADKGQAGPLKDAATDIVAKVQAHLDQIRAIRHTL